MSVKVRLIGRLGNNLFQYALGRILSQELDLALDCLQVPMQVPSIGGQVVEIGNAATLTGLSEYFPNAPLCIPGRCFEQPVESFEMAGSTTWRGQTIPLDRVLQDGTPRQIRLCGWFQRYEYYSRFRRQILNWYQLKRMALPYTIRNNDILINIRRGADYGISAWTLPLSYYECAIASCVNLGQVYVCGTCIDDNVKKRLAPYKPIYFDAEPIQHFNMMLQFDRIVLSNSTFAWWCAFLSDASEIIAPRFTRVRSYSFSGFEDVDLKMQDRNYRELPVGDPVGFALFSRNQDVSVKVDRRRRQIKVFQSRGHSIDIQIDDSCSSLIAWILSREGPITFSDLAEHYHGMSLRRTLENLISWGLLLVCPTYLDETSGHYERPEALRPFDAMRLLSHL